MSTTTNYSKRLEIDCTWNGNKGKMVLVADIKGAALDRILKNCVHVKLGQPIDFENSLDIEEYIVQISQKIIKSAPTGFDINVPDNIRNLDLEVYQSIKKFIAQHYAPMGFLSDTLLLVFGPSLLEQSSSQPTISSSHVDVT